MGNPSNRCWGAAKINDACKTEAHAAATDGLFRRVEQGRSSTFTPEETQRMVERWRDKHQTAEDLIEDCQLPNSPTLTKKQCENYLRGVSEATLDLAEHKAMPLACKRCPHRDTQTVFGVRPVTVSKQPKRVTILKLNGYLSIPQAAKQLDLHDTTVRQLCREGKLIARKVRLSKGCDRWMVKESSINKFKGDADRV